MDAEELCRFIDDCSDWSRGAMEPTNGMKAILKQHIRDGAAARAGAERLRGESNAKDVGEIVAAYLERHDFDGLHNGSAECACESDDLAPCGSGMCEDCEPGYRYPCDCGDHDFHIGTADARERYYAERQAEILAALAEKEG